MPNVYIFNNHKLPPSPIANELRNGNYDSQIAYSARRKYDIGLHVIRTRGLVRAVER